MRVKSLKNITNGKVRVKLGGGASVGLHPGCTIENVSIDNEKELKGKVHIVKDLTEVMDESPGKTRLDD